MCVDLGFVNMMMLMMMMMMITLYSFAVQPANGKSEELGEQSCEGATETEQVPMQCNEAGCEESVEDSLCSAAATATDPATSSPTACNGSVDCRLETGCRSGFASGDRLALKTLTSSDKLSVSAICSPVDEQQSPMSSTSSFLMPTPTTEEMCDDWSLMSDNKSEGGDTATGTDTSSEAHHFFE